MLLAYIDGLSEPSNPGTGTYAYLIYDGRRRLAEGAGLAGLDVTSNYAEYTALVMALRRLKELHLTRSVTIRSDSQLLVGQMSGKWKAKGGAYLEKYREARELAREFEGLEFQWVPREQNEEADLLSRVAYQRQVSGRA